MVSLLLALIYLSFISLGLPDSLLGAAWPVMHLELGSQLSFAGVISMIVSAGTVLSSLASDYMIHRFGAGRVTAISVATTALALFGYSTVSAPWQLCLWAIPYGLGAGAVDAALNNYVALHFSSRHMSWLHAFWGVGATLSPNIMAFALASEHGWRSGYITVSAVQIVLAVILIASLPLWKRQAAVAGESAEDYVSPGLRGALRIRGVPLVLIAFFCYCSMEATAGLWASSYFVEYRGVDAETAAHFASLFYLGLMSGRFLSGFVADRLGDKQMLRIGCIGAIVGLLMVLAPLPSATLSLFGLVVLGVGCAPIYPSIIHSTPDHFGKQNSQAIVGIQMASAYIGCTFMPSIFGLIAQHVHIALYPYYMLLFTVVMLIMTECVRGVLYHKE
ncbi:MAG: MFS transporter [Clostridia bacterium]|nr:MFS transporter [Clostridia bacterium]